MHVRAFERYIPWNPLEVETLTYNTGPHSAVGNLSGNRCESDCRSRGPEFDPGPVPYFMEIDNRVISMVILLPSTESFKKGCCQLQAKVCTRSTG